MYSVFLDIANFANFRWKKCWCLQNARDLLLDSYIFWIFFRYGITLPSSIIEGYVWQILGRYVWTFSMNFVLHFIFFYNQWQNIAAGYVYLCIKHFNFSSSLASMFLFSLNIQNIDIRGRGTDNALSWLSLNLLCHNLCHWL